MNEDMSATEKEKIKKITMTIQQYYKIHGKEIDSLIALALKEDKVKNDVTTSLTFGKGRSNKVISAVLLCKQDGLLAGLDIFKKVYKQINKKIAFLVNHKDGDKVNKGNPVLEIRGQVKDILTGERTALNFLQRMSGIATLTDEFVNRLKYEGSQVLHTRKTTPNFRVFELAAVKIGGGEFHRYDLSSSVMIKDNHEIGWGSLETALENIDFRHINKNLLRKFEVEVKTMHELKVIADKYEKYVKVVMLDNFKPGEIKEAVEILKEKGLKIEISGGLNDKNFEEMQYPGVDYYSIGMLTHSYKSQDFSLEF
jgi:nicotinate-nucleotide pyrophosphorylase (carboxylating)